MVFFRSYGTAISRQLFFTCSFKAFPLSKIDPEFVELLELLHSREQFDELAKLFEHTLRPWNEYSEEERKWIVERATSLMSKG
jgi:hypothetical protein